MERTPRLGRAARSLLLALVLSAAVSLTLAAQATQEKEARGFVGSMAALVYGTAWPTATYESWQITQVERLEDGLALLVRLSGQSNFGGELWLEMVFEWRKGHFYDLRVHRHNAILVAPFKTSQTIAALAADMAQEFASSANREPPPPPPAAPPFRQVLFVSRCDHPIDLWLRLRGVDEEWVTRGVWRLTPNDTTFLASGGERLELTSSVVYSYAEIPNRNYAWPGEREVVYEGRTLPMRTDTLPTNARGSYQLRLTCDNLTQPAATAPPPEQPPERKTPPAAELVVTTGNDAEQRIVLRRPGRSVRLDHSFSAETEIRNLTLRSVGATDVVVFDTEDEDWTVRYWWHLTEDELFYSALGTDGKRRDSSNFAAPAGSVGDWMRRTFLLPWLKRP